MNREIIESENFVTVCTDKGLDKRKKTNNIFKILETENNIEEIQSKIDDLKYGIVRADFKKLLETFSLKYIKIFLSMSIPVAILFFILAYACFNLSSAINTLPISAFILIPGCKCISFIVATIKANKLYNIYSKRQLNLLSVELENQKQNLKELYEEAIIDKSYDVDKIGKIQKVKRTDLINNLKRKLELIEDYQFMKKELIKYSEDHFISTRLLDAGYSESDINFIHQLLEEDKKVETKNEIHKSLLKK